MARRELKDRIESLESRIEGLERLLAELLTDGRIVVNLPDPSAARVAERDQERPSPAWRRD